MNQKIVILDYSTGTIYIRPMKNNIDPEDILDELDLKLTDCEWMIANNLKIDL